ncbi:MAG TPA: metallophosphoesterase, partial [Kofleriaceae bacterium]|nr:metallophosphoesterase [Kofleriaceae bacterium]
CEADPELQAEPAGSCIDGSCVEERDPDPSHGGFTFVTVGDHGAHGPTDAVLDLAPASGRFLLSLGDLSYGVITPEQAWCDYVREHIGADFPFLVVAGNHEDDGTHGALIDDFIAPGCLPAPLPVTGDYAKQYWFDSPPAAPLVRFILISPGLAYADGGRFAYPRHSRRYQWTARTIDEARAAGIPWVIVGMHTDCITAGRYGCETGSDILELLVARRVDLILQGHEHNYQRSHQLTCATPDRFDPNCIIEAPDGGTYAQGAGSVLAIVGTGGRDSYALALDDPEAGYFAALADGVYGLLQVRVTADRLDAEFLSADGAPYSDRFRITR